MTMTRREAFVITAYTGITMMNFGDFHKGIEKQLGRPIWTHELGTEKVWEEIKESVKDEFLLIAKQVDASPEEDWETREDWTPEEYTKGVDAALSNLPKDKPVIPVVVGSGLDPKEKTD